MISSNRGKRRTELKYYGFHTCLQLWKLRPQDVIRVYLEKSLLKPLAPLLKWCADHRKAYHVIPAEELEKVTQSVHHEGVCLLAYEPESKTWDQLLAQIEEKTCLLYLDGIQNPHNVGSIIRSCAHFGIKAVLGEEKYIPKLSGSMGRIAKGGIEYVPLIPIENPKKAFKELQKKGFNFISTSSHGGKSLYNYSFSPKTVVILGSESTGVSPDLLQMSQDTLFIPGTDNIESLNVAVAASLFLGEYWRQSHCL